MKIKLLIIGLILTLSIFIFTSNGYSAWTTDPTSINFGDVPVGTSKTVPVVITNTGAANIDITGIYSSFSEIKSIPTPSPNSPVTLTPGQIITVAITFTPTTRGNYSGEIVITSNDPVQPSRTLNFTGNSTYATGIDVSPSSIDFGSVPINTSKEEVLRVRNNGNSVLNVTITVTAGTPFTVSKNSFTLRPGQIETLIVTFNPNQKGIYTGALTVVSDDRNTPKVVVSLRGETPIDIEFGLSFFPTIMNFGYVQVNTSYERLLRIYNTSANIINVSLTIQNISGNSFVFPSSTITSFTIIPGESRIIPISFTPTEKINYSGFLFINTNTGTARISLIGTGSETGNVGLEPQNPPPSSGSGGGGGCSVSTYRESSYSGNAILMFAPLLAVFIRKIYRKIKK